MMEGCVRELPFGSILNGVSGYLFSPLAVAYSCYRICLDHVSRNFPQVKALQVADIMLQIDYARYPVFYRRKARYGCSDEQRHKRSADYGRLQVLLEEKKR